MKIITRLPDLSKYIKDKSNDQTEKLLINQDGVCFNEQHQLSSFLSIIAKIPQRVTFLQMQFNNVIINSNSLEKDLQKLKLNFSELDFQLEVSNFIWNNDNHCYDVLISYFSQLLSEQNPYKLTLDVKNMYKIEINQSLAFITVNLQQPLQPNKIERIVYAFISLFNSMKDRIKQLDLSFKINQQLKYEGYIIQFIESIGALKQLEKQIVKIKLNIPSKNCFTKDLFNFQAHKLQKGRFTSYQKCISNNLLSSSNMTDSVNNLKIYQKEFNKHLILSKLDKNFTLNVKQIGQFYIHSEQIIPNQIINTIDSWNIYKLSVILLALNSEMLQTDLAKSLKQFIQKQRAAKSLTIEFDNFCNIPKAEEINTILSSLSKLQSLEELNIQINNGRAPQQNRLGNDLIFTFQQYLPLRIQKLTIKLQNLQPSIVKQFCNIFKLAPNLQNLIIDSDNNCQYIKLQNEELEIKLQVTTNSQYESVLNSLNENNFLINKQLTLNLNLQGFNEVQSGAINNTLSSFSSRFVDIKIQFSQYKTIPFEQDFIEELNRERSYSLTIQDEIFFKKVKKDSVLFKLDDLFKEYLYILYPKENNNNADPSNIIVINDDNKNEDNHKQIIQIDDEQEDEANDQRLKKQKKRKNKKGKKDNINTEFPKQFKNFFEMIQNLQNFKECTFDFSNIYSQEFLIYFAENINQFRLPQQISLNLSSTQMNDTCCKKWRQFFTGLNKKTSNLKINCSNNMAFHNQGAIELFYSLNSLRQNLLELDVNLSQTSIKKRGIISLMTKIKKFKLLKVFRLNISNSLNSNYLKFLAIKQIFFYSSDNYLPNLEEFCLKASQSKLKMDQEFFNILGQSLPLLSKNLKILSLNFQNNIYYNECSIDPFLQSLSKLSENLTTLSLNFKQVHNQSEKHLLSVTKIPKYIQHYEQLQYLSIKTGKFVDNDLNLEKYSQQLISFLKPLNFNQFTKLSIDIYDLDIKIKNNQFYFRSPNNQLASLQGSNLFKAKFAHFLSTLLLQLNPNIIISTKEINELYQRLQ